MTAAKADAGFYKYPMMYRADAPPAMPPGADRYLPGNPQPYVKVMDGVWYWPGADSVKLPVDPAFDPRIEASKVIKW
jgi:hypothetical protein